MNSRYNILIKTCDKIREYLNDVITSNNNNDRDMAIINATNSAEYLTIQMRQASRLVTGIPALKQALNIPADAAHVAGYGVDKTAEGWYRLVLPPLIRRKYKKGGNIDAIRGTVYELLKSYSLATYTSRENMPPRLKNQVVIFKHMDATKMKIDYDNMEKKIVLDVINTFMLRDDTMDDIDYYECGIRGETVEEAFLVVYITPRDGFIEWLGKYKDQPETKLKSI